MKKSIVIILTGLLLLGLFVGTASATITGSGTSSDPYLISTAEDLNSLAGSGFSSYTGGKYFKLANNITTSGSFGGIGSSSYPFDGNFNGNNKTLTFNGETNSLFQYVKGEITVRNLNVYSLNNSLIGDFKSASTCGVTATNVNIYNSKYQTSSGAPIFGFLFKENYDGSNRIYKNTTINGCHVYNSLIELNSGSSNNSYSGFFIGEFQATNTSAGQLSMINCGVHSCMFKNISTGVSYWGGLVGRLREISSERGIINACTVENLSMIGKTTTSGGTHSYGGMVGYLMYVDVSGCSVLNSTIKGGCRCGGIAGYSDHGAVASGTVSGVSIEVVSAGGHNESGGIFGDVANTGAEINSCSVVNTNIAGGTNYTFTNPDLFTGTGNTSSGISNTKNVYIKTAGASLTNNSPQSSPKNIGSTVTFTINGQQGAAVYLDSNGSVVSGYTFSYGTGGSMSGTTPFTAIYSSTGVKSASVTLQGWNGTSTVSGGSLSSLVYIKSTGTLNGSGTQSDPYQVGSDSDWIIWATDYFYYDTKYMAITNDFTPTRTIQVFSGNLEGNNHILSNFKVMLFANLRGTAKNLKLSNAVLVNQLAPLAGGGPANVSNITIENCFIKSLNVGGIIGDAGNSTFTNCTVNHTTIVATGTGTNGKAGGICYAGNPTVINCRVLNCDILGETTYGVCP